MQIFLEFNPAQGSECRARLQYAFRLFCAIYGHQPLLNAHHAKTADVVFSYSHAPAVRPTVRFGNAYTPRPLQQPASAPTPFSHHGESTILFHSPNDGTNPDWLAEIFEWVSCADEYSIRSRDYAGRVPCSESYAARHGLDVRVPYAALAMRLLQIELCRLVPAAPLQPCCPVQSVNHFIVPSHDVDFLPIGYASSIWRLVKNAAISISQYHCRSLAVKQAKAAMAVAVGDKNPLDQLSQLASRESARGIKASYYFLPRRAHRRDGNYCIDDSVALDSMRMLEEQGMEVGVHGSYTSLEHDGGLASEYASLQSHGFRPMGSRQHWLRFTLDRMIPALELAGAQYDTSVGWSEKIGFRAGACFAFPPYDFHHERPAKFLEIPMIVMEVTLRRTQQGVEAMYQDISELLSASRRYGWGGVSLLWHPTAFGEGQLSREIGELYWRLADKRTDWNDTWISAGSFIDSVRQRYIDVGLLHACEA